MGPNPNSSTAPTANVNGVFAGHTALQAGSQNGHLEGNKCSKEENAHQDLISKFYFFSNPSSSQSQG